MPMLLHRMALVSVRLFCKNLGNLQECFGKWFTPPPPLPQKIACTPMHIITSLWVVLGAYFKPYNTPHRTTNDSHSSSSNWWRPEVKTRFSGKQTSRKLPRNRDASNASHHASVLGCSLENHHDYRKDLAANRWQACKWCRSTEKQSHCYLKTNGSPLVRESMTVLDSGFHVVDSGFQLPASGFQKGLDSNFFSVLILFFAFRLRVRILLYWKTLLECITSLFSFSIYKLREECITVP